MAGSRSWGSGAAPVLDSNHRDAACVLEVDCPTVAVKSSYGVATNTDFHPALDNVIAKDGAMKKECSGG
ncbi:hypothetical protein A5678_19315 [Mycobacterium sp. E2733]|nr:hypothetical protein A5678_19315 [Mycobacterium sp. E2733]